MEEYTIDREGGRHRCGLEKVHVLSSCEEHVKHVPFSSSEDAVLLSVLLPRRPLKTQYPRSLLVVAAKASSAWPLSQFQTFGRKAGVQNKSHFLTALSGR